VPALLDIQPGWVLMLGGLVLLIAGLILLWLARAQSPSDAIQYPLIPSSPPPLMTFTPLLLDEPLLVATQPAFAYDLPHCYDTPTADLLCLGQIKNTTDQLWKNISLTVQLQDRSQRISLEQTYVLPGHTAPYRVIWPSPEIHEEEAVMSALPPQAHAGTEDVFAILTQDVAGLWLNKNRYRVRGMLQNPYNLSFKRGQIVVTLLDSDGAVVGYRLRDLPSMSPDARMPFLLDLAPTLYEETLIPKVTVLAWMD
jgi:hypothetical protein